MEVSDPTGRSWQINVTHGGDLTLCLYMRDRMGLRPDITPRLAALAPRVPASPALPEQLRPALEEQWVNWWEDRLRAHWEGRRPHFDEPVDSFPELAQSWALYEFVRTHAGDGREFVDARKREFFDIFRAARAHSRSIV